MNRIEFYSCICFTVFHLVAGGDFTRYFLNFNFTLCMKRITIRKDLMNKSEYSKKYSINRVKIDKLIEDGKLAVERVSGIDYIKLETK